MSFGKNLVNIRQVQSTNDASIISKCSMVQKNYIKDEFVKYFVEKEKPRASLIHLGYYTRAIIFTRILNHIIKYLHIQKLLKIVSCGCGFDTTYWRLTEENLLDTNSIFVEIDYASVINRKISLIQQSEKLKSILNISEVNEDKYIKKLNFNYFLLCADLSNLDVMENLLRNISIDFNAPTLFLSECVITYMKEEHSNSLIKWISDKFKNCAFINYEQIHPEDGFGNVMLKHFNKLQSKLHSVATYPNCQSHKERYQSLGFEKSLVYSEWDFYTFLTSTKERNFALTLEQFDEFEELHLKCVHYVVAVATNNAFLSWSNQINSSIHLLSNESPEDTPKYFDCEEFDKYVKLYGHTSCHIKDEAILVFGGFTLEGRSKKILKITNEKIEEIPLSNSKNKTFDSIHGSAVSFQWNGKNYIGLYGGRTNPKNVCNNGKFLLIQYSKEELSIKLSTLDNSGPIPRYRHSMVCYVRDQMYMSFWIFGGRTHDLKERLDDLWQLVIHQKEDSCFSYKWQLMKAKSVSPCGRMSHSAVVCSRNNLMYITCGIDTKNYSVLNDIWKWSFALEIWEPVIPKNENLIPRYGHTSHISKDTLYLLGGVNIFAGKQPGLAVINLHTLQVVEYTLQPCRTVPLLLFNHSSLLIDEDKDNDAILILGGGGNCFSFGTYFNEKAHILPLKQFRNFQ